MMLNTTSDTLFGSRIKPAVYFIHQPTIRVRCRDWRANVAGIRLGVTLRIGLTRLKGKIHARWQHIKTQETAWNRWMSWQKFYRTFKKIQKHCVCEMRNENMHLVSRIWCLDLCVILKVPSVWPRSSHGPSFTLRRVEDFELMRLMISMSLTGQWHSRSLSFSSDSFVLAACCSVQCPVCLKCREQQRMIYSYS